MKNYHPLLFFWQQIEFAGFGDGKGAFFYPQFIVNIFVMVEDRVKAGANSGGVYRTTDGGATPWSMFKTGMESNDPIWALIVDPNNPDIVWAGSRASGIYRWVPFEGRWTHVNSGLSTRSIQSFAISPNGQVLYAASSGEGIFRMGKVYPWEMMIPFVIR